MQKQNVAKRVKKYEKIPLWAYVLLGVALACLVLYLIAVISPKFANGFNGSVGAFTRAALVHLTSWIPFSLAEIFSISLR